MRSTSRRSARVIPKTEEAKADTNGTPPIDLTSEPTSTTWVVELVSGRQYKVTLPGNGRISYGHNMHSRDGGGEVRFYRNASTKVYEGVLPDVKAIHSEAMTIELIPPEPAVAAKEKITALEEAKAAERREKRAMDRVVEAIVNREYAEETTGGF